jgi:O-antigen/teichoic acid export membrane protein
MTSAERLRRRRCIALRIAVFFAILLAAFDWRVWGIVAVAVAGGLLAIGAYWRDCRNSGTKSSRTGTHARDS